VLPALKRDFISPLNNQIKVCQVDKLKGTPKVQNEAASHSQYGSEKEATEKVIILKCTLTFFSLSFSLCLTKEIASQL
jgi:hypothetical protein